MRGEHSETTAAAHSPHNTGISGVLEAWTAHHPEIIIDTVSERVCCSSNRYATIPFTCLLSKNFLEQDHETLTY